MEPVTTWTPDQLVSWLGLVIVAVSSVFYWRNNLGDDDRARLTKTQYLNLSIVNLGLFLGPLYLVLTARTLARSLAFFAVQVVLQMLFGILQELWLSERVER